MIIGVGEKVAEVYVGPMVGGAIENWFAYMLALAFLLFRPQGLFGEKHHREGVRGCFTAKQDNLKPITSD